MQKHSFIGKNKWTWYGFDLFDVLLIVFGMIIFTTFFIFDLCSYVHIPHFFKESSEQKVPGWQVWITYIAYFSNILNIANMILTVKKKISNCYFGLATIALTGLITLAKGLVWQTLRFWGIGLVGQVLTLISWIRSSKDKIKVETRTANWLYFTIMMVCVVIVTILLTWIETNQWFADVFGIPDKTGKKIPLTWYMAFFDALPLTALTASIILVYRRENQYWIVGYILSVSTLVLWILQLSLGTTNIQDWTNWQMLAGALLNLGFTVKGHIDWMPKK